MIKKLTFTQDLCPLTYGTAHDATGKVTNSVCHHKSSGVQCDMTSVLNGFDLFTGKRMLTRDELKLIENFLVELSDRFGNDGSNDYWIEDTPGNRKILETIHSQSDDLEGKPFYKDKKQLGTPGGNSSVIGYLIDRVRENLK